jgi:hypothetical protein
MSMSVPGHGPLYDNKEWRRGIEGKRQELFKRRDGDFGPNVAGWMFSSASQGAVPSFTPAARPAESPGHT